MGEGLDFLRCPCGRRHRLEDLRMQALLEAILRGQSPVILLSVPAGTWWVPRVWITFHGLRPLALPRLARRYGWARVSPPPASAAVSDGEEGGLRGEGQAQQPGDDPGE